MSKKKRRDILFVTLSSTKIEVTGFNGSGSQICDDTGMHEAVVTDVLRAVKVKVALISTVLTMKKL
jgi:hypothetical protein